MPFFTSLVAHLTLNVEPPVFEKSLLVGKAEEDPTLCMRY